MRAWLHRRGLWCLGCWSATREWLGDHGIVLAAIILSLAIWDQSWNGRRAVIANSRAGCERNAIDRAAQVNNERGNQGNVIADRTGNLAVAADPGQPPRTRRARSAEAATQLANLTREDVGLLVLDSHIDRGNWQLLFDPRDQRAVLHGTWVRVGHRTVFQRPFRCEVAYPAASPFEFGG